MRIRGRNTDLEGSVPDQRIFVSFTLQRPFPNTFNLLTNNGKLIIEYGLKSELIVIKDSTVNIGFCDQPPSEGSGSLNPKEIAKSSGLQLDITTTRSQNTGLVVVRPYLIGYSDQYRLLFTT